MSIFAGRIADAGVDPVPIVTAASRLAREFGNIEVIWASAREPYNLIQADHSDCHIITMPTEILEKLSLIGKDLEVFSRETVEMFYRDACQAGITV